MSDVRQGRPSCSALDRLKACPGSLEWSNRVDPVPPEPWTTSGEKVHDVLALKTDRSTLTDDEAYVADRCDSLAWDFLGSRGITQDHPIVRDVERLWLTDARGNRILSGMADVYLTHVRDGHTTAIILDYKTGRLEVEPAPTNLQLRGLVACAAANEFLSGVEVAVIQPWSSPQLHSCFYSGPDIDAATAEVTDIAHTAIDDLGRTLNVGDHCKYCAAKGKCPATQQVVTTMAAIAKYSWGVMSPEATVAMYHTCGLAVDISEAFRADVKRRMIAGERFPGLRLKPGTWKTKILSIERLFNRMLSHYPKMLAAAFTAACSMTKGNMEELVKEESGLRGKALEEQCKLLLEDNSEAKQSAPTIERDE